MNYDPPSPPPSSMKCVFIQGQIMLGQNPNPLQIFEGERASEGREILELRTCHSFPPQSTSARRDVEKHPVQRARQSQLNAEQSFEIQSIISSHYQSLVHNFFWLFDMTCWSIGIRKLSVVCVSIHRDLWKFRADWISEMSHVSTKNPTSATLSMLLPSAPWPAYNLSP